ncbi:MAG: hypothetical protein K0R65_323 [Crocinitomicaceae bacterium]|jgi:chemotaxis protein histidine kinase CheA|nr:hypothetical protein [Crocinitomicaceae bacterium]
MNLTGIISISGKPGLYKVVAQGKNNIIVESLEDKKRIPAYSSDRISALDDISIYTYDEDVSLKVIFKSIYEKENGAATISHKEDKSKLEKYLLEVLPNYDQERVYPSDVKKIFQWYNLLHQANELKFEEEKEEASTDEAEKPAKKAKSADAKEKPAAKEKKAASPKAAKDKAPKAAGVKKVAPVKTGGSRGK